MVAEAGRRLGRISPFYMGLIFKGDGRCLTELRPNLEEEAANRFEAGQDARVSSVEKMRRALEAAGLEFIPEKCGEAGIRFRERSGNAPRATS